MPSSRPRPATHSARALDRRLSDASTRTSTSGAASLASAANRAPASGRRACGGRAARAFPSGSGSRSAAAGDAVPRPPVRVHVPGRDGRAPPGDRKQRDVQVAGEQRHVVEDVGVAREVDAPRPGDEKAERRRTRPERAAVARRGRRASPARPRPRAGARSPSSSSTTSANPLRARSFATPRGTIMRTPVPTRRSERRSR